MKKFFILLIIIITAVIVFPGCNFTLNPYNDYDYLDTVNIAVGEKLYQKVGEWTQLDSITFDLPDSNLHAWFTCQIQDSIVKVDFNSGGYELYYLGDHYSYFFSFYCMDFELVARGDSANSNDYIVNFIVNAGLEIIQVEKPNIYLYPEKKTKMTVSLEFPYGGEVTESIP